VTSQKSHLRLKGFTPWRYKAKLPWAALKEGFTPATGDIINLDIVLTDNDGEGREDWLQWTPGYMEKGEPSYYGKLILR